MSSHLSSLLHIRARKYGDTIYESNMHNSHPIQRCYLSRTVHVLIIKNIVLEALENIDWTPLGTGIN